MRTGSAGAGGPVRLAAPKEGCRELAAANLQTESYLERAQRATDCAWRRARNKRD
jgi:hypothetical protein